MEIEFNICLKKESVFEIAVFNEKNDDTPLININILLDNADMLSDWYKDIIKDCILDDVWVMLNGWVAVLE